METPTSRSLDFLRKQGYIAAVVEQWVRHPDRDEDLGVKSGELLSKIRVVSSPALIEIVKSFLTPKMVAFKRDLFNFADIVAVRKGTPGTVYVQTTSRDNQSARIKKLIECPHLETILATGNKVFVHGWAQVGAKGTRKLWKVSVHKVDYVNGSMQAVLLEDPAYEELTMGAVKGSDQQNSLFTQEEPF